MIFYIGLGVGLAFSLAAYLFTKNHPDDMYVERLDRLDQRHYERWLAYKKLLGVK